MMSHNLRMACVYEELFMMQDVIVAYSSDLAALVFMVRHIPRPRYYSYL